MRLGWKVMLPLSLLNIFRDGAGLAPSEKVEAAMTIGVKKVARPREMSFPEALYLVEIVKGLG